MRNKVLEDETLDRSTYFWNEEVSTIVYSFTVTTLFTYTYVAHSYILSCRRKSQL